MKFDTLNERIDGGIGEKVKKHFHKTVDPRARNCASR